MQTPQELRNDFDWDRKNQNSPSKGLRVLTKNEENPERFQENFEIF